MDYYTKKKGINTDCMKVSSYHKQRGDQVNFVETDYDITRPYDLIYIVKKDDSIPNPPMTFFDKRSRVWGEGFRYLSNWKIPDVILACRPDYLLYHSLSNEFERADMAQFFNDKGELLPLTQDYINTFTNKKTLVIDRAFWKSDVQSIIYALDQLKESWNVAFSEPISLKKVVCDKRIRQKFLALEFTKNSKFKFWNDLGDTYEDAVQIVDFLTELKEHAPTTFVGEVFFDPVLGNHFKDKDDAWADLERCLKIINLGKENGFMLKINPLKDRFQTPYYTIFETISSWSQYSPKSALFEYIAFPTARKFNCTIEEVYMDSTKWDSAYLYDTMSTLYRRIPWIKAYCLRRWKNNFLEITKIDWKNIEENV